MSRKKQTALTPEEKLAAALVPEEEQPYPVPGNWRWTWLSACITASKEKTEDFSDSDTWYVGLEHMEKDSGIIGHGTSEKIKSLKNVFHKGQLLYGKLRPYLNKHDIAPFDGICSTDILVFESNPYALLRFINYFLNQGRFIEYVISNSKGINLPRVSEDVVLRATIALPPLPEQQRIVSRIESLFSKLDEAKEKAQAVVDGFKNRRSAILHKAFTGELTEQWRLQNGVKFDSWYPQKISECCAIGSGGTPSRKQPEYYSGKIPWIKTGEINWNEIYDAEEHISKIAIESSSAKLYHPGAVLVAMYGMGVTRGRAAILRTDATTNQAVCVLQPKEQLYYKFLYYYFMCHYWDIRSRAVGGNQLNLSGTIISKFIIKIPSRREQDEITHILDNLLEKEHRAKAAAEAVLTQIDTMKKAILARAFRGQLGTNDPADEPAVTLLK